MAFSSLSFLPSRITKSTRRHVDCSLIVLLYVCQPHFTSTVYL